MKNFSVLRLQVGELHGMEGPVHALQGQGRPASQGHGPGRVRRELVRAHGEGPSIQQAEGLIRLTLGETATALDVPVLAGCRFRVYFESVFMH